MGPRAHGTLHTRTPVPTSTRGYHQCVPLIVDAYNVLHTTMPPGLAGLDERWLCLALARSVWGGDRVVVVCDGSVKPHGPAVSPVESVELIYSGPGRSADDVIVAMIGVNTAPRMLTVVSSDREIQKAARRRRCRVMSSDQLVHVLAAGSPGASSAQQGGEKDQPAGPLSEDEVQQWLERFGIEPGDPPEHDEGFG
jgi:predicted RNA-binding protein with PIN domain